MNSLEQVKEGNIAEVETRRQSAGDAPAGTGRERVEARLFVPRKFQTQNLPTGVHGAGIADSVCAWALFKPLELAGPIDPLSSSSAQVIHAGLRRA